MTEPLWYALWRCGVRVWCRYTSGKLHRAGMRWCEWTFGRLKQVREASD